MIVTDGFAGNVALKTAEGLADYLKKLIRMNCAPIRSRMFPWRC